jgi:hypothetical protein
LGDPAEAKIIAELNREVFSNVSDKDARTLTAKADVTLRMPATFRADRDMTLREVMAAVPNVDGKAAELYALNKVLPAEAEFKRPQPMWPALLAFGGLVFVLWLVGTGRWLKGPEDK